MKESCPHCGVRHVRFPRHCYYSVHGAMTHAIIARVASGGTPLEQEFVTDAEARFKRMEEYAKRYWPDES